MRGHDLLEFGIYILTLASMMPPAQLLQPISGLAAGLLPVIVLIPLPFYIVKFRWGIPASVDSLWWPVSAFMFVFAMMIYVIGGIGLLIRWVT